MDLDTLQFLVNNEEHTFRYLRFPCR